MKLAAPGEDLVRHQRRTALLGATLVLPFAALDIAQTDSPVGLSVALSARAAWFLSLAAGAALLCTRPPRFRSAAALVSTASAVAPIAIVAATGGARSGYFSFLLSLSLCMVVLLPGRILAATASGAAGIAAGAFFLVDAGVGTVQLVRWTATGAALSVLAGYATYVGGRLVRRELEACRSRAEAATALAESERRRASVERLAIVGRLAAGIAHEINNPLGFVKANLSWVRDEVDGATPLDRAEIRTALAETDLGVERIRRIVADLRGFAREEDDGPCGVPPGEAIEEALRLASVRTRGIRVDVAAPAGLPIARICRRRLVQVLLNLVVNAADAIEEASGGPRDRWIAISARPEEGGVALRVEDGGQGIPEEALPRMFEPFFTTKPAGAGLGLGLALSNEYLAAVGGTISASNGPHGGAVFDVRIPRHDSRPGCMSCVRADPAPAGPQRGTGT